jgi:hypothetical protein
VERIPLPHPLVSVKILSSITINIYAHSPLWIVHIVCLIQLEGNPFPFITSPLQNSI